MKELDDLLELGPVLKKQVRKLSLGERMKCELAAALLHRPKVLFLDEPTIGLDVTMQVRIRDFVGEYNRRHGATVILTSHYMADVTALCERIIVIDKGQAAVRRQLPRIDRAHRALQNSQTAICATSTRAEQLAHFGNVESCDGLTAVLHVPREKAAETASRLLNEMDVDDVNFEDPPVEDIIRDVFAGRVQALQGEA